MDWEYNPDPKDILDHMDCSLDADLQDANMDWEYANDNPDPYTSDEMDWDCNTNAKYIPDHMDCIRYAGIPDANIY
jgi:hypothetical protein